MPIVDLDFEEELKETNFPDLLDGVPSANTPLHPSKRDGARRKVIKEKTRSPERRRPERTSQPPNSIKIVGPVPVSNAKPVRTTGASRKAVDPPSSPEGSSGTNKDRRDDGIKSRNNSETLIQNSSSAPSSKPLQVPGREKHRDSVSTRTRTAATKESPVKTEQPKLVHKSIKRDFIEQVELSPRSTTSTALQRSLTKLSSEPISRAVPPPKTVASSKSSVRYPEPIVAPSKASEPVKPKTERSPKPGIDIQELHITKAAASSSSNSSISSMAHEEKEEGASPSPLEPVSSALHAMKIRADAQDLLERAKDRVARQKLQEQVQALEHIVERKNTELEELHMQLRRAVETKSDLVLAHNEMEKRNLHMMEKKEENLLRMKQANIWLLEAQSIKEKELLNEIIRLTDLTRDQEQKHREELDDWERMHRNEMLEKDYMIAQLTEEMRQHGIAIPSPLYQPPKQQHRGVGGGGFGQYYDPTSIITGAAKFLFH
jgi:hypothetical protein